jgi:hypothetical protein
MDGDAHLPADRPPILTRTAGPREHVAVRAGAHKLTHELGAPGTKEPGIWRFVDLASDPAEEHPFATAEAAPTPELEAAYRKLRRALKSVRAELRTRAQDAARVEVDDETRDAIGEIGYGDN